MSEYIIHGFNTDNDHTIFYMVNPDGSDVSGKSYIEFTDTSLDVSPLVYNGNFYCGNLETNDIFLIPQDSNEVGFGDRSNEKSYSPASRVTNFIIDETNAESNKLKPYLVFNDSLSSEGLKATKTDSSVFPMDRVWDVFNVDNASNQPIRHKSKYYTPDENGNVYCYDSGGLIWSNFLGDTINCRVSSYNDSVIAINQSGEIYSLDVETGNEDLIYDYTRRTDPITENPIVIQDTLYFVDRESSLISLDLQSNSENWITDFGQDSTWTNGGIVYNESNGDLYITSQDNYLYAINKDSGNVNWRYNLGDSAYNPTYYNGNIYSSTLEGTLFSIAQDGTKNWQYTPDSFGFNIKTSGSISIYAPTIVSYDSGLDNAESVGTRVTQEAMGAIYKDSSVSFSNFIFEKGIKLKLKDIVSNNYVKQEGVNISDTGDSKFSFISGNGVGTETPEITPSAMWVQTRSVSSQWQINLNSELITDQRFVTGGSSVQNGNLIKPEGSFLLNTKTEKKGAKNHWIDEINGSSSSTCCIRNGKVYLLYDNGTLYRYDLSDGNRDYEKSVQTNGEIAGPPVAVNGYLYYVIRRSSGWYVVQAEQSTGSTINSSLLSNPAGMLSVHNQRIVVGTRGGLKFFDESLNTLTTLGSDGAHMLIIENDTAFTQGQSSTDQEEEVITSWDLDSMAENWSKKISTGSSSYDLKTPLALGPENLYTAIEKDNESLLYAISRFNGEKQWENKVGDASLTPVGVNYFDDLAFITAEKVQDTFDGDETVYKGNAANRYTGETYDSFNSSTSGDFTGGGPYYNTLPFLKDSSYTGQDSLSVHGIYHNDNWNPW